MASVRLTEKYVKAAAAPKGKRIEVFDQQVAGLVLRVTDQGRKTWVLRYRTEDGRQPRFTLGTYPSKSLANARTDALKLIARTKDSYDPAAERRKSRLVARSQTIRTFADLAAAYIKACELGEWTPKGKKKRPRTLADDQAVYRRYVEPILGDMRLAEITRAGVKKLLRDMVARGIHAQTNRTHAFVRQVFAYAISEFEGDLVAINPATGFSQLGQVNARTRILDDDELRALWGALTAPEGLKVNAGTAKEVPLHLGRPMAVVLQLCTILLQRENEIAGMRVPELNLKEALWLIPGERMKGGLAHLVPLPPRAVELIGEALSLRTDRGSPVVFPSPRDAATPVRPDSVSRAMARVLSAAGIEGAAGHDLRRTGSTLMTSERLRISQFDRSLVLAHYSSTGGGAAVSRAHYDANSYLSEKRVALAKWEDLLLQIVGERSRPSNVMPLTGARA
jgi:integrase